ncbi:hypothetical protein L9F63_010961 [Diploptera punctata]|uniref:Gustatory receptor n=1 Tax=Diploptera punctata TaxID=6984 RepID=A0AAD8EPH0_DIPPU|nr:hypothetical protein L9F63_010961 [Diploptera punctata]
MEDARSLISAIRPLYYISKLCGLASYGIFSVLWSLLQLAIVSSGFVISLRHKMSSTYKTMASKAVVADVCMSVLLFGTAISSLLLGFTINRKKLYEILRKMSLLDQIILRNRLWKVYKKMLLFLVVELLVVFLYLVLIYSISFNAYGVELLAAMPEVFAHTINLVNVLQFVDVELLLKTRYHDINTQIPLALKDNKIPSNSNKQWSTTNQILQRGRNIQSSRNRVFRISDQANNLAWNTPNHCNQNIFLSPNERMRNITNTVDQIKVSTPSNLIWGEEIKTAPFNREDIRDDTMMVAHSDLRAVDEKQIFSVDQISELRALREMHSDLYDIVELIDFHFGFPILMELASNFVSLVSTLYTAMIFMKTTTRAEDNLYMYKFLDYLFWTLLYLAKASAIAISCHSASEEASKSISVVQKVLLEQPLIPSVSSELHLYLTQLCNNHVDFTACGFFSVNLSLLHAIVGATATYIIILIQLN